MLEGHLIDGAGLIANGADKGDDGADVATPGLQLRDLGADVEILCWTRITLASGHRREEGDLARGPDRSVMAHMGPVDRRPDHLGAGKGVIEFGTAGLEPGDELGNGGDIAGNSTSSAPTPVFSLTQAK